ncbi:MAG: 1-acyl-sn-glycerol-3-phosphate acyltransferase [Bacteroidales bacterium]|nr:1-acyl-sn-glycerol-3-phosphate acyltransferase [Bacteroidales bacterium]
MWDIFLIYGWIGIDIKWIMKKELRKIPGLGFGSAKVGHIFLDRSNARAALESINQARKILVNGTSVVVFPEGTRSKTGKMGAFKRGAFKMATDFNLPILPVTVNGTHKIMRSGTFNLMPGSASLTIHKPILPKQFKDMDMDELANWVRETIGKKVEA